MNHKKTKGNRRKETVKPALTTELFPHFGSEKRFRRITNSLNEGKVGLEPTTWALRARSNSLLRHLCILYKKKILKVINEKRVEFIKSEVTLFNDI